MEGTEVIEGTVQSKDVVDKLSVTFSPSRKRVRPPSLRFDCSLGLKKQVKELCARRGISIKNYLSGLVYRDLNIDLINIADNGQIPAQQEDEPPAEGINHG